MNEFYVYVLFRPWNGSPFYIGKGKGRRWRNHLNGDSRKHPNQHLASIVRKAKKLGLEIPAVKVRECLVESQAFEIEAALIKAIGKKSNKGPLVNMTDGGEGASGLRHSKESRAAIGEGSRRKVIKDETRAKLRAISLGNKHCLGRKESAETKAKKSATMRRTLAERGPIIVDDVARANMRDAQIRRFADPEVRLQHGNNLRGRQSIEAIEKKRITRKALWEDPNYRSETMAKMKIGSSAPDVVAKKRIITASLWTDPEYRAKQHGPAMRAKLSAARKKQWADPVYRAMILQARAKKHQGG